MTPEGFSDKVPGLRLIWDASALKSYMKDPCAYYWQYVQGWQSPNPSVALQWGIAWGGITANYRALRLNGYTKDDALVKVIDYFLKSPDSHALAEAWQFAKEADQKKRSPRNLIRSLIWWADEYENDGWNPLMLPGGKPALEYNFLVPLGLKAETGEDYLLAGYFDEIVEDEDGQFIVERKSTTQTISGSYFQQFDPCVQTYMYDLVGSYILPKNPLRGVVVEACQTVVEFSRFERHEIQRSKPQREHFEKVLKYWVKRAEEDALHNRWDVAINSESNTFWSVYKDIERRHPAVWPGLLKSDLKLGTLWNPTTQRTVDILND